MRRHIVSIMTICLIAVLCGQSPAWPESPQVLRIAITGSLIGRADNGTLDPLRTYQLLFFDLQHHIFETLVRIDPTTQEPVPCLASSWKFLDEHTLRFSLQHGVRFHNGEPLTAEAVKFSFDLMNDPRNRFAGRFLLRAIKQVAVVDDYTVDIHLKRPDALLFRKIAAMGFVLPPGYYRQVGTTYFTRHPMGTGPFRLFYTTTNARRQREFHLVAHEDYWGQRPQYHELVCVLMPAAEQWPALVAGNIDILVTRIPPPASAKNNPDVTVLGQPSKQNAMCLINIDKPGPLQDVRVRRALQHAVDRAELLQHACDNYGTPLFSTIVGGVLGHTPRAQPRYAYDRVRARQLLEEAGYTAPLRISAIASDDPASQRVARELARQYATVGVTLAVRFLNRAEILAEIITPKLQGDFTPASADLWIVGGWPSIFHSGAYAYFIFLTSKGMFNLGIHLRNDSPIDRLYHTAVTTHNPDAFRAAMRRIDDYLLDQAIAIPLFEPDTIIGLRRGVQCGSGIASFPHIFSDCTLTGR